MGIPARGGGGGINFVAAAEDADDAAADVAGAGLAGVKGLGLGLAGLPPEPGRSGGIGRIQRRSRSRLCLSRSSSILLRTDDFDMSSVFPSDALKVLESSAASAALTTVASMTRLDLQL